MRDSLASLLIPGLLALASCADRGAETTPTPAPTTTSTTPPPPPGACSGAMIAGIEVAARDFRGVTPYALGYQPYALDGCLLVYLAPSADGLGAGALRLRDLATGDEQTIADASEEPRRPSIAGQWITWEATVGGAPGVRVKRLHGGVVTVKGSFDHAGEPRAGVDAIVFTAWLGPDDTSDSDIYLYRPDSDELVAVSTSPKQQRFPDISADHLAWTDFGGDASGFYQDQLGPTDEADIVVFDRATGTATTRYAPGKQGFPILGAAGKVAYLDWVEVQPEPKLNGYALKIANLGAPVESDIEVAWVSALLLHVRPIARGTLLEWVDQADDQSSQLRRRRVDLATPATTVSGLDGLALVGPTASDAITLVGVHKAGVPVELRAFAR